MSEPPNDSSGLTPGDPLGHELSRGRPAYAPPEAGQGYTSPPPPGALGGATAYAAAPVPAAGRLTLAGWWSRVGATLIDAIIVGVGAILITLLFGAVFSIGFAASDEAGAVSLVVGLMLAVLAFTIGSLLYAPVMMARTNGRTLGRMALGIRVVRANGQPVTFWFAMLREVLIKSLLFGVASSV